MSDRDQRRAARDPALHCSILSDAEIQLFRTGRHFRLHQRLGAHVRASEQSPGTHFAVWAPNAGRVSVIADFNGWESEANPLHLRDDASGIWEGFVENAGCGHIYKYQITSRRSDYVVDKGDPFAFHWEVAPRTGSVIRSLDYDWADDDWMQQRGERNSPCAPISIYEVHLGSWKRVVEAGGRSLGYREIAQQLADYVINMGFTHVEIMPIMEHPFFGSWGYQSTGFFSPTSRYGTPQDFMALVDTLHQCGIGVILDWVPSHFPGDQHGLAYFDGTYLFEHADPKRGVHPEWNSYVFNYGRPEVCAFLISNALFWIDVYHADGLRIDAVASMLYLDYARQPGEWVPNEHGGNEDLDAVRFLRTLNEAVSTTHPEVQIIAEESTAWPMVSRPSHLGGLGFGMKWNMGWMNDALHYFSKDPIYRKFHHDELTFSLWYAFSENFLLPLSHDEVVHGKSSLLGKMPGDDWQRFANLRLLLGYQFLHPGKKLLFMGAELGQWREWNHDTSLDWHLLEYAPHRGIQRWLQDLNQVYRSEPALHELDFSSSGFQWIDRHDAAASVISFARLSIDAHETIIVVLNFTPLPRYNYRIGVPASGTWREVLNSDAHDYGGSGQGNFGGVEATPIPSQGEFQSLCLTLPPLGVLVLQRE